MLTRSGRSALVLALEAAGIGPGGQVLVPNYYCPTMVAPIERVGASPVFYPINAARAPDITRLEAWQARGPAALLAVHYFGLPVPLGPVRGFCDRRGLTLIEDCAHAFYGGTVDEPIGQTGDYVIASLPKFLPVLEGGALASRRRPVASRRLPAPGVAAEFKFAWNQLEAAADDARTVAGSLVVAVNSARGAIAGRGAMEGAAALRPAPADVRSAALSDPLLVPMRLRASERWIVGRDNARRNIERRRLNYRLLAQRLAGHRGCLVPWPDPGPDAVPYVLPLLVPSAEVVFPHLRQARLPVYRWDRYWPGSTQDLAPPMHEWGDTMIQVSCHQDLDAEHVHYLADTIIRALPAD